MVARPKSPRNAALRFKRRPPNEINFSAVSPPAESLSSDGDEKHAEDDDDDGEDRDDAASAGFSLCKCPCMCEHVTCSRQTYVNGPILSQQ